ncbi:MAG: VanZ family protein [Oscillospiraceae bacterium]|nr:VanZ family protein [Oscillospiraceae bacterium]
MDYALRLFFEVVPITCLVGAVYGVLRYRRVKKQGITVKRSIELARFLFVCYLTGLINLVLVPNNLWTYIWYYLRNGYPGCTVGPLFQLSYNLVPSFFRIWAGELTAGGWVKTMLTGNLLMLAPMGLLLPFVTDRLNKRNMALVAVGIPVAIELLQPIVGRSFDVDDILMNFLGILVGFAAAALVRYIGKFAHEKTA